MFKSNQSVEPNMNKLISSIQNIKLSNNILNAVLYGRCSTPSQNTDKQKSLETQIGIGRMYCTMNNFTIIEEISEVVSGHNSSKQSYLQILDRYSSINLIIADPSRLSRNVSNAQDFIVECLKKNIIIHFIRDNLILDSLHDCKRAINSIYDAFIESSIMSKRISSAIRIRRQLGSHIGKIPFGYTAEHTIDKKTGIRIRKIKENNKEQIIIKIICSMFYGTKNGMASFYKMLHSISKNTTLNFVSGETFSTIYYGNINLESIMHFLNENNILNRDEYWKKSSLSFIVRKYKDTVNINRLL